MSCIGSLTPRRKSLQKKKPMAQRKVKPADTVEGTLQKAGILDKVVIPVRKHNGKFRAINQKLPPEKEAVIERMQALPRPVQVELVKIAMRQAPIRSANPDDEAVDEFDDVRLAAAARPLILAGLINVPEGAPSCSEPEKD